MPSTATTKTPFYYVKIQPNSFISLQNTYGFVWSTDETGVFHDISLILLQCVQKNWIGRTKFYADEKINAMLAQASDQATNQPDPYFWQKKQAVISLETYEALDSIGDWKDKAHFILLMLYEIRSFIYRGYLIGIDFREVFLVQLGEMPPSHFRHGIDVCVTHISEYKKLTERLSYQLGKAIFYKFPPHLSPQHQAQDTFNTSISEHYSNSPHINYTTRLKNYRYHTSTMEAFVHYYISYHVNQKVVALTSPKRLSELEPFFQMNTHDDSQEITIVLKGHQYEHEYARQHVYNNLLSLIKSTKCTYRVHVILITKEGIDDNLLDLRPKQIEKNVHFQPLDQGKGYYLSSSSILSATYRNIQALSNSPESWELELFITLYNTKHQKKHSGAYIRAHEASADVRIAKTFNRSQLKSKVKLMTSQQQSIAQTQVLNQQVQESQVQQAHQVLQQSMRYSSGTSSWFLPPCYDLDEFCKILMREAKDKLPKIKKEEAYLKDSGFLTELYLKHHSRVRFYEQLATDDNFRLRLAAKLFGVVLLKPADDSNSLYKVKLPYYYVDHMNFDIACSLSSDIESQRDGIFEEHRTISESYIFGKILSGTRDADTSFSSQYNEFKASQLFSLASSAGDKLDDYIRLDPCVLVGDEELASIPEENRVEIIQCAESLISLFKPHQPLSQEEIHTLEQRLLVLTRFYYPDRLKEIARLEQFIAYFKEHNEDNIKILVQVLIRKHKSGLDCFLKLLAFLEERSVLSLFYKIHFKYALNISSVDKVLDNPFTSYFIKIIGRIPVGKSEKEIPYFERLCLHVILFAKQNNLNFTNKSFSDLENLWERLYLKFLTYSGNQEEEAQQLLMLRIPTMLITDSYR